MGVKLVISALLALCLLLVASCTTKPQDVSMPAIYIIKEQQPKTFVVGGTGPLSWEKETRQERNELNKIRALREYEDEQEEFELKSKLSNVRRIIDHELVVGYDEELDDTRWVEVN
ncbi:hypothetical protein KY347_01905 [Candidatus Woesearchaeota archaeon]|nr:hypothetical protein [Candidatus Woesearchaeota archaeon]